MTSDANMGPVAMFNINTDLNESRKAKFAFNIALLLPSRLHGEKQFEELRARDYYLTYELNQQAKDKYMPQIDDLKKK